MNVSIIGLGFVGLTTAVCLAGKNIKVNCIDTDKKKIDVLSKGISPFYEQGLSKKLSKGIKTKNLNFLTNFSLIDKSDIIILAVGTPSNNDGSANLSFIRSASRSIGQRLKNVRKFQVIAVKSTVPPGTTTNIVKSIIEKISKKDATKDFGICSNPEFLKEGTAIYDTLNPDRIVIGSNDEKSFKIMKNFYEKFYRPKKIPIVKTNAQTAELIKYANNSFLATKISFINTIANISQRIPGTDVEKIAEAIGLDSRINPLFLKAGLGYGGSCFPKDVTAIINLAEKLGYSPELLKNTHKTNQMQPLESIKLLKKSIPNLKNKTISVLGLAFKPNTSDIRESVSIKIIKKLKKEKAKINVHDPMAIDEAKIVLKGINFCSTIKECIQDTDGCIIATEWEEYKKISPQFFKKHMKKSIIIDGRRALSPKKFTVMVDDYQAIGLGKNS